MAEPRLWRIEELGRQHDRSSFSCGVTALDRHLRHQASQDARRRVARVFVAIDAPSGNIAGYYTLSAGSVERGALPQSIAKRLPRYPVPTATIGRLAVATSHCGRGLGGILLADALQRVLRVSRDLAVHAVIVDAKDDGARRFYEHFGFRAFPDCPHRLFLPMATVAALRYPPSQA